MLALSLCLNWHLGSLWVLLCVAIPGLCFGRQSKLRLSSVNLPFFSPCFLSRKPLSHPESFPHKLNTESISPWAPKCHHLLGETQVFLNSFAGCWQRSSKSTNAQAEQGGKFGTSTPWGYDLARIPGSWNHEMAWIGGTLKPI